jgi:hypothetical protein
MVIRARKKWSNKNKTRVFIGMKKIGVENIGLVTFVLRISVRVSNTIDTIRVGMLRHDWRMKKIEYCREKKDEDSRNNLESEERNRNKMQDFEMTCRERKETKCARDEERSMA